jgi:hypothetical protein
MNRAVIQNGQICALDPLPADWRDGRELIVEEAEPTSTDDLEEYKRTSHISSSRSLEARRSS